MDNLNKTTFAGFFAKGKAPKKLWLAFVLFLFAAGGTHAATMSGTYTVCNSGCNYTTINAAVTDVKNNGVSGPVVISIAGGKWSETLSFSSSISGASATNT